MKQAKHPMHRLLAAVLALAMVLSLAACSTAAGQPSGSPEPAESVLDDQAGAGTRSPDEAPSREPAAEETEGAQPPDPVAAEDDGALSELIQRMGLLDAESIEISDEDAREISMTVAGMESSYLAGPGGKDPLVKERDWGIYSNDLAKESLTRREAAFYDRLEALGQKYLTTSALSGVKKTYTIDGQKVDFYATNSVKYSDLGLTDEQAVNVYHWFRYNSPQYYFLNSYTATSQGALIAYLFDFMYNGESRANITNELFDKLDGWIQTVEENAQTTWQKELYANNLICESVTYNHDSLKKGHEDELSLCQTIYSSVMQESTVCTGYARTFASIMSVLGVDTAVAISSDHAWNVVRFDDGNYYAVDVCWNDNDDDGDPYNNRYLNVGDADSKVRDGNGESHTYSDSYVAWIPAVAKKSYSPTSADTSGSSSGASEQKTTLDAPQNVKIIKDQAQSTSFSWDKVKGADQYQVAVFHDPQYQNIWVDCLLTNPTTGDDGFTNLVPNSTYYYGIRAVKTVNGQEYYSQWTCFSHKTPAK